MEFASSGRLKCPKCFAIYTDIGEKFPCQRKNCGFPTLVDKCDHEYGTYIYHDGKWHCGHCDATELQTEAEEGQERQDYEATAIQRIDA